MPKLIPVDYDPFENKSTSRDWPAIAEKIGQEEGLPLGLWPKVIETESRWNPNAVSNKGARGFAQLLPSTAKMLNVNINDPEDNLRGGARYLKQHLDKYNGDVKLALAAYNAGPANVDKYGGVPPFKETQNYVNTITSPKLVPVDYNPFENDEQPTQTKDNQKSQPQGKSVGGFLGNAITEMPTIAKGILETIKLAGKLSPVGQFLGSVGGFKSSGSEDVINIAKNIPSTIADTVISTQNAIKEKGLKQSIYDYVYEHPLSTALNVSGGLGVTGQAAKLGGLTRTANLLNKASRATDPMIGLQKTVSLGNKTVNRLSSELLGSTTGSGRGAIRGSIEHAGEKGFTGAMRGKISGEEIAQNAKDALETVVTKRGENYRNLLAQIDRGEQLSETVTRPISQAVTKLASREGGFDISIVPDLKTGKMNFDFSSSPVIEQQSLVQKALSDVANWSDNSVLGLDELKKRLGVYSRQANPRSPAAKIIGDLERSTRDVLTKNVPRYAEMTKGYAEATNLIKDIESGLMLRKTGMSGRVTADNTLRRLTSAMKENFEMRKDLLEALGKESGTDIMGQVAGYSMNQALPHGLMGRLATAGTMTATLGALSSLNLNMLPVVFAASPRVVGEFLNVYGRALKTTKPVRDVAKETAKRFTSPAVMGTEIINSLGTQGGTE